MGRDEVEQYILAIEAEASAGAGPPDHSKHDDRWCKCGLRIEDCDHLQENLARSTGATPLDVEALRRIATMHPEGCAECGRIQFESNDDPADDRLLLHWGQVMQDMRETALAALAHERSAGAAPLDVDVDVLARALGHVYDHVGRDLLSPEEAAPLVAAHYARLLDAAPSPPTEGGGE